MACEHYPEKAMVFSGLCVAWEFYSENSRGSKTRELRILQGGHSGKSEGHMGEYALEWEQRLLSESRSSSGPHPDFDFNQYSD